MPELAAIYASGLLACLALTVVYVLLRRRRRHSDAAQTLQANLRKVNLYWSDNRDAVVPFISEAECKEDEKAQRAVTLTGALLSLLSWAGVAFLLLVMISERFLARSRRERKLFSSRLIHERSLSPSDVREELSRLDVMNASPAVAASDIADKGTARL